MPLCLGVVGEGHAFGCPQVVAAGGGLSAAEMVDDNIAEHAVKPRDRLLAVLDIIGALDRLDQTVLQEVFGVSLVAHAGSEKRFERLTVGKKCGCDFADPDSAMTQPIQMTSGVKRQLREAASPWRPPRPAYR